MPSSARTAFSRIDIAGGVPEGAQKRHLARVIPHARSHDAPWAGDASHLPYPSFGVAHEVDDELRERSVEGVVRKRQVLRCGLKDFDVWKTGSERLDERV